MKRTVLILTLILAPLYARPHLQPDTNPRPSGQPDSNMAGTVVVRGVLGGLWAASAYLMLRLYRELKVSNDLRQTVATRGFSDLLHADLSKVASPDAVKLVAAGLASAAVAYVLYEEIRKQFSHEDQETSA